MANALFSRAVEERGSILVRCVSCGNIKVCFYDSPTKDQVCKKEITFFSILHPTVSLLKCDLVWIQSSLTWLIMASQGDEIRKEKIHKESQEKLQNLLLLLNCPCPLAEPPITSLQDRR